MSTPPGQWGQPQQPQQPQYPQQQQPPPPQQPWGQPQDQQQQQQQWGQQPQQQQQWGQPQYQQQPGQAMQPAQYGMQQGYGMPGVSGAPLSSAGKRFGAFLLEYLLVIVTLGIGWLIWWLIAWGKGQTPAKQLLGMRAVKLDTGWGATWGTMALRELVGKSLLGYVTLGITTLVSCFMILGSSRQGLWDKIANTVIVDDPEGRLVAR